MLRLSVSWQLFPREYKLGRSFPHYLGVGTRFVASVEAGAPKLHKELVVSAGFEDAVTTLIYTGRPLRVRKTPYVADWEANRQEEIKELTAKGVIPHYNELEKYPNKSLEGR